MLSGSGLKTLLCVLIGCVNFDKHGIEPEVRSSWKLACPPRGVEARKNKEKNVIRLTAFRVVIPPHLRHAICTENGRLTESEYRKLGKILVDMVRFFVPRGAALEVTTYSEDGPYWPQPESIFFQFFTFSLSAGN